MWNEYILWIEVKVQPTKALSPFFYIVFYVWPYFNFFSISKNCPTFKSSFDFNHQFILLKFWTTFNISIPTFLMFSKVTLELSTEQFIQPVVVFFLNCRTGTFLLDNLGTKKHPGFCDDSGSAFSLNFPPFLLVIVGVLGSSGRKSRLQQSGLQFEAPTTLYL